MKDYTGLCFDAAFDAAREHHSSRPVIVHGWLAAGSCWYVHAWVEVGDRVFDYTKGREAFPKEEYLRNNGAWVEGLQGYLLSESERLMAEHKTYGPFDYDRFYPPCLPFHPALPGKPNPGEILTCTMCLNCRSIASFLFGRDPWAIEVMADA